MSNDAGRSREPQEPEPKPPLAEMIERWAGKPELSGSPKGEFTLNLLNGAVGALWAGTGADPEILAMRQDAVFQAMRGIEPKDPVEGMLAAQMVATHDAAMECFRRAHLPEQSFEGRKAALGFANKLVRSYAALVDTLDKHRGKGQQVVRVEHVTVQAGGQAIVGAVAQGGISKGEDQPHAHQLVHAPEPEMRGADPQREPVPVARGER